MSRGSAKGTQMSWFDWLSRKPRSAPVPGADTARAPLEPAGGEQHAQLRDGRIDRRERLYGVVRAALLQAGVPSGGYKLKVLALDDHGNRFLIMVDLAPAWGGSGGWRSGIEAGIIQAARAQHGLVVTSVYWRSNADLATASSSAPAALSSPDAGPSQSGRLATAASRYEPIQEDEVAAFQKALDAASRAPSVSRKVH